jgi:hypothetical protein
MSGMQEQFPTRSGGRDVGAPRGHLTAAVLAIPPILAQSLCVTMQSWPLQRPDITRDAGASRLAPTLERVGKYYPGLLFVAWMER